MKWILAVSFLLAAGVAAKSEEGEEQHHLRNGWEPRGSFVLVKQPLPGWRHLQELDCMGDEAIKTGLLKLNPDDFGCTSKDVRVADTKVLSVDGQTEEPFTCIQGTKIEVQIAVDFENGASSSRSDVGLWLSQDGGDAKTGNCKHFYFPEGPLEDIDDPPDSCGDLNAKQKVSDVPLDSFILTCTDKGIPGGQVIIGSCIGWKVPGADEDCDYVAHDNDGNYAAATLPATKSKCRCEDLVLPIDILRRPILEAVITCDDQGTDADGTKFIVTQTFSGSICNNKATGAADITEARDVAVDVVDGNDTNLFSVTGETLESGECFYFNNVAGRVTAGFTGTCDATFEATVTGTGKDIVGNDLEPVNASAVCPVCDCPPLPES